MKVVYKRVFFDGAVTVEVWEALEALAFEAGLFKWMSGFGENGAVKGVALLLGISAGTASRWKKHAYDGNPVFAQSNVRKVFSALGKDLGEKGLALIYETPTRPSDESFWKQDNLDFLLRVKQVVEWQIEAKKKKAAEEAARKKAEEEEKARKAAEVKVKADALAKIKILAQQIQEQAVIAQTGVTIQIAA